MMKRTLTCPQCDGKQLAHVTALPHLDNDARMGWVRALPLTIRRSYRGVIDAIGGLELFVCRSCSFVELYAIDVNKLDPNVDKNVRFIDNEPKATLR